MKYIQSSLTNKLVLFCILIFLSCSSNKKIYKIKWNTNYPIFLYKHKKENKISTIEYPVKIILENNSFKTKKIRGIEYVLGTGGSGFIFLNKEENGKLMRKKHKSRKLHMFQKKEFIAYATSYVDTTKIFQNNFKVYLEKMLIEKKDSLCIEVSKFRKKHPNLLKKVTKGDEIFINTKEGGGFIPADWEDK